MSSHILILSNTKAMLGGGTPKELVILLMRALSSPTISLMDMSQSNQFGIKLFSTQGNNSLYRSDAMLRACPPQSFWRRALCDASMEGG